MQRYIISASNARKVYRYAMFLLLLVTVAAMWSAKRNSDSFVKVPTKPDFLNFDFNFLS